MKDNLWGRRSFLKAALAASFFLIAKPTMAMELAGEVFSSEGRLNLYRAHTGENLKVVFRSAEGEYDPEALKEINHILRCRATEEEVEMDIRVIEYLNTVDKLIGGGGNEIEIISGYRSKSYNDMLRRRSRRVARYSLHLNGQAVDFRIPGISLKKIRNTALDLKAGGVGYYPRAGFIHLDSGRFRQWGGRAR